jgi:hypothetical protein
VQVTRRDRTWRPLHEPSQLTALVSGLVTECAVALLLWSLHWETLLAGVTALTCGLAVYAWCGGFHRDQR